MVWIWIAAAWVTLGVLVALLVVRAIRLADRRAAETEPNVVAEPDPAPVLRLPPGGGDSIRRSTRHLPGATRARSRTR